MLAIANKNFQYLITQMLIDRRFEKALKEGCEKYQIKQYKILELSPNKIVELYNVINAKLCFHVNKASNQNWQDNQLRIYIYLLMGYLYISKKEILDLNSADWHFFSDIFCHRDPLLFEFQALSIIKANNTRSNKWNFHQANLLDSIIRTKSIKNKWNEIAKQLFLRSDKQIFKTSKQCREYWINHLDPVPLRTNWTLTEDIELVATIMQMGKKWSKVSKKLGGRRTEHMVKNRFNSLYNFQLKEQKKKKLTISQDQVIQCMLNRLKSCKQEEINLQNFQKNIDKSCPTQNQINELKENKVEHNEEDHHFKPNQSIRHYGQEEDDCEQLNKIEFIHIDPDLLFASYFQADSFLNVCGNLSFK